MKGKKNMYSKYHDYSTEVRDIFKQYLIDNFCYQGDGRYTNDYVRAIDLDNTITLTIQTYEGDNAVVVTDVFVENDDDELWGNFVAAYQDCNNNIDPWCITPLSSVDGFQICDYETNGKIPGNTAAQIFDTLAPSLR